MADTAQTPEAVALALLNLVMLGEGKKTGERINADKAYILNTYRECSEAVRGTGRKVSQGS